MYLLPFSTRRKQLHMETLIPIFFRGIDIVGHTARSLLKHIGQHRIDVQTHILFRQLSHIRVNDANVVNTSNMREITTFVFHFSPHAERRTETHFGASLNPFAREYLLNTRDECFGHPLDILFLLRKKAFYLGIFLWTAITERQIF